MSHERIDDLKRFYSVLTVLENRLGGTRRLSDCSGRMNWPGRGVYFFQEPGEHRSDTGDGQRIVRVGTHALKTGSGTKLWTRLSQHRGSTRSGGGNHRGSIFRLIVGAALINRDGHVYPTWGQGSSASREVRDSEQPMERVVSEVIRELPFLWLAIEDEPGPDSMRKFIETNTVALLSNFSKSPFDSTSQDWLGHLCDRERVRKSGLWNSNHVDDDYDPAFLQTLEHFVDQMGEAS